MALRAATLFLGVAAFSVGAGAQSTESGLDLYGDALPRGAIARLGTVRLRHAGADNHHGASVTCLAYAPGGKSVATGGGEGSVRIWDAQTGKELLRVNAHAGPISSIAYSPGGDLLVSGGGDTMLFSRMLSDGDRTVRVWDVATGRELRSFKGHEKGVTSVAFSPDGKSVASGSQDGTVRVWNLAGGQELAALEGYKGGIVSVFFSPDGRSLLTVDAGHQIRRREISGGYETLRIPLQGRVGKWPNGDFSNLSLSSDGLRIVSVDGIFVDRTVRLWDAATGREIPTAWKREPGGHDQFLYAGLLSPDGRSLATRGGAGALQLWSVATGRKLLDFVGHEYDVSTMAFSPDGKILVSGGDDRTIRFWDVQTGKEIEKVQAHGAWVDGVAFSPDSKSVATTGGDATVRLWDSQTGRPLRQFRYLGRQNSGDAVAYTSDGRLVASSAKDCHVRFWDPATGHQMHAWPCTPAEFNMLAETGRFALAPDGQAVAVYSKRGARLLDIATGKELLQFQGPSGYLTWLAFSPDGRILFTTGFAEASGKGKVLEYWDRQSGKRIRTIALEESSFPRGAVSADGRTLALSAASGTIRLLEVATGKEIAKLPGHRKHTSALCFSPDGAFLASGGYDRLVRLWDPLDGREAGMLEGHAEHVSSMSVSADGKLLASASADTTALVWDVSRILPQVATSPVPEDQREALWADLGEAADVARAHRAVVALSRAGDGIITFVKEKLLQPSVDLERTGKLLAALDHADPSEREKAAAELLRSGAESVLRKTPTETLSLEARGRLGELLSRFDGPCPRSAEGLRAIRGVAILERLHTPKARAALAEISRDETGNRSAAEAKAALDRFRPR
jgi:WD40 repeat protein